MNRFGRLCADTCPQREKDLGGYLPTLARKGLDITITELHLLTTLCLKQHLLIILRSKHYLLTTFRSKHFYMSCKLSQDGYKRQQVQILINCIQSTGINRKKRKIRRLWFRLPWIIWPSGDSAPKREEDSTC